jgi:hypothetical protein
MSLKRKRVAAKFIAVENVLLSKNHSLKALSMNRLSLAISVLITFAPVRKSLVLLLLVRFSFFLWLSFLYPFRSFHFSAVHSFESESEVIKEANAVRYGLAGSLWTSDLKR